jgi:hypothetical protein
MTTDGERRRELRAAYDQRRTEAGVYLFRNAVTGRIFVGSSPDLGSVRNRLEFGQATGTSGVLDRRMAADARIHGMGSFTLEVLDELTVPDGTPPDVVAADLKELEALWREKLADVPQY